MARIAHLESRHQVAFFRWARMAAKTDHRLRWIHASMNGVKLHSAAAAGRAVAEGMTKGILDVCLPWPARGRHGLYLEFKSAKGRTTEEQDEFIAYCEDTGYAHAVCRSWTEAKEVVDNYLGRVK